MLKTGLEAGDILLDLLDIGEPFTQIIKPPIWRHFVGDIHGVREIGNQLCILRSINRRGNYGRR
jgi:hypothetical protein